MKTFLTSLFSGFLVLSALPASAVSISVMPSTLQTAVGSSIEVQLIVSGLGSGAAPSIGTYDVDFSYNPSILNYTGSVFGDPILGNQLDLFDLGNINEATPGVGFINLFELSFDSLEDLDLLQADTFTLATLFFDALSIGTSDLSITLNALGDADGNPLQAQIVASTITTVPLPSAWLLYVSCFFIWGAVRNRFQVRLS